MSTNDQDIIQRFIFDKQPVRGEVIHLQHSFQTIVKQHAYPPAVCKLLGEALCIAALLSSTLKFEGRLMVQFRGEGKLKLLLAQCDHQFHIRGLAKWEGDASYDDLMRSFTEGILVIMLDTGIHKSRYQGIVNWQGYSLAESIEGYFKDSEQLMTKIWLQVNETSAFGLMLQAVPPTQQRQDLETCTVDQSMQALAGMTAKSRPEAMVDLEIQKLLHTLYPGEDIRIFSPKHVTFHCPCTQKSSEGAILVLGQKEAEEELKNHRVIVVTCDFCNKQYTFDAVDIAKLFHHPPVPPSDISLH